MKYEQNIPFYIHKFKDFPWKVYESEHYVFHVGEKSLAESDIDVIKTRQESAYAKIIEKLELAPPGKKIIYYFYSSQKEKAKLMGDGWYGQTICNEFTVHAVYNEKDKVVGEHEDTHLLSLQMGLSIGLFEEGLAEFMVGKSMFGNNHNDVIRSGLKKGLSVDIKNLMSQQGWLDTPDEEAEFYYSVAGSFVAYIYGNLGLDILKKIYSVMDRGSTREENIKILESVIGQNISELEASWRTSIN